MEHGELRKQPLLFGGKQVVAPVERGPEGAVALRQVWLNLDASMHNVLERVTVADLAAGELPRDALTLADEP